MFLPKAFTVSISVLLCEVATALRKDGDTIPKTLPTFERVEKGKYDEANGFIPPQSIIDGDEIAPHSRPYLVSLGVGDSSYYGQFCAGSLISPHAVMTAARCVYYGGIYWAPPEWVEFNRHNLTDFNEPGVVRMKLNDTSQCDGDAIYHPNWNWTTSDNDVAILFLPDAVRDITPVKLNDDPNIPIAGSPLDVAGWGLTEFGFPSVPSAVTLNYITNQACTKKPYRWKDEVILNSMMCSTAEGKSQCYGDSGGPVVMAKAVPSGGPLDPVLQVGIVSFVRQKGLSCYDDRFPNGQTRVSEIVDWVKDTVCERKGELCRQSKSGKPEGEASKAGKSELDTSKAGKSELDTSKAGKSDTSKTGKERTLTGTKNNVSTCQKVPTFTPWPTFVPTVTAPPYTPYPTNTPTLTANPAATTNPPWYWKWPTYMPSTSWPTWVPTKAPMTKSDKNTKA
eukprot:CCRYP_020893-RA/>CCRYP_020893-RA protein AED:0.02 eAED:0.02 QI:69/1/0.66/1/1/1/3/181/450